MVIEVARRRGLTLGRGARPRFDVPGPEALQHARTLAGGSADENAAILESIFGGETGPRRDVILLNAGAALVVAGRAGDLAEGIAQARDALDAGAPRDLLARLRADRAAASAAAPAGAPA